MMDEAIVVIGVEVVELARDVGVVREVVDVELDEDVVDVDDVVGSVRRREEVRREVVNGASDQSRFSFVNMLPRGRGYKAPLTRRWCLRWRSDGLLDGRLLWRGRSSSRWLLFRRLRQESAYRVHSRPSPLALSLSSSSGCRVLTVAGGGNRPEMIELKPSPSKGSRACHTAGCCICGIFEYEVRV